MRSLRIQQTNKRTGQNNFTVPVALSIKGVFMVCYQILAQFAFYRHKPVLVSTRIKKQNAKPFLVLSGLLFGSGLKYRRFFHIKKEASGYIAYLRKLYADRTIPNPALPGGQLSLF
jgi:hypothetical protein